MRFLKFGVPLLLVVLVVVAIVAPIGPLPGFFIGGEDTTVPDSWQDTSNLHELRLKVPGALPRVVIIWMVEYDGDLYVVGSQSSGWVGMIGAQSPVAVRIEDSTYQLLANKVTTGWQPVMQKYIEKYQTDYPDIIAGFPSIEDAEGKISVFRLGSTGP